MVPEGESYLTIEATVLWNARPGGAATACERAGKPPTVLSSAGFGQEQQLRLNAEASCFTARSLSAQPVMLCAAAVKVKTQLANSARYTLICATADGRPARLHTVSSSHLETVNPESLIASAKMDWHLDPCSSMTRVSTLSSQS